MNSFLSLDQLDDAMIASLLDLARQYEASPHSDVLRGRVIALLFMNPSLRTLVSMQSGIAHLGGQSVVIQPGTGSWNLETRDGVTMDGAAQEHVRDALPVLASYSDMLGIRAFAAGRNLADDLADELIPRLAQLYGRPLMNLESANDHPCQALADWKALDDAEVPTDGTLMLSWTWHPRALPYAVPNAVATMALRRGMRLRVCAPAGFGLPESLMARYRQMGHVETSSNPVEAMTGAHAVYPKSWASASHYGDAESDQKAREGLRDWCADESWFSDAAPGARVMHCLPVRRNVEIRDELIEGPRSLVQQQAANRLHGQKAVLHHLAGGLA